MAKADTNKIPIKLKWLLLGGFVAMALISTLPTNKNPYQEAIRVIAQELKLETNELELITGSHTVFMLFESVHVELKYNKNNSQLIKAELNRWPWRDYTLSGLSQT